MHREEPGMLGRGLRFVQMGLEAEGLVAAVYSQKFHIFRRAPDTKYNSIQSHPSSIIIRLQKKPCDRKIVAGIPFPDITCSSQVLQPEWDVPASEGIQQKTE